MAKQTIEHKTTTTKTNSTTSWSLSAALSKLFGKSESSGPKRCPTCGKFMGGGKSD